ncbi:uncharacterized protein I303_103172 [Kwoniella dejecticola CBS 10117]|uniref:Aminoglycoside phosphotransferase domain-containing protein n=1 Tax=Kwoniella dejecticola CBS 10117 TaxID=1296121 RepID=A0AAJ8KMT9_9TREE
MPELFEYPCQLEICSRMVVRWNAICSLCDSVWCDEHNTRQNHPCILLEDIEDYETKHDAIGEAQEAVDKARVVRLVGEAQSCRESLIAEIKLLRPGCDFTLEIPNYDALSQKGWFADCNIHLPITFDDGVKWFIRVRQRGRKSPAEITDSIIRSEVCTLNLLKRSGIPVPEAWLPRYLQKGCTGGERLPINYFFYEVIEGKPLHLPIDGRDPIELPEDEMRAFVEEYAKLQIRFADMKLPFNKIGCLVPAGNGLPDTSDESLEVGPIYNRGTFMKPTPPYVFGPFSTIEERYLAHIDATLEYILRGALQKDLIIEDYLWHLELREYIQVSSQLNTPACEPVFIKHADERGDHLMRDHAGHIVGILDWEWAYVTTKEEAFSAPSVFNLNLNFWRFGDNSLRPIEQALIDAYTRLDRPDLADCVRDGKIYNRLEMIGQYDPMWAKSGFREVFGNNIPADFNPPEKDYDWVQQRRRKRNERGYWRLNLRRNMRSGRKKQYEEWKNP